MKEQNPSIWCGWVLPSSKTHKIQGGGYFNAPDGNTLKFESLARKRGHIDGEIIVKDADAVQTTRDLAKIEGIFGGFSSGANCAAAVSVLRERNDETFSVCFIVCDSGLKYLSTDLYQ